MPRGISWDSLPNHFDPNEKPLKKKVEEVVVPTTPTAQEERKFDLVADVEAIGRRGAFGVVVCLVLPVIVQGN